MDYSKKQKDNLEEGSLDDLLSVIRQIVSRPPSPCPQEDHSNDIIDLKRPLPDLDPIPMSYEMPRSRETFSEYEEPSPLNLSQKVQDDLKASFQTFSQSFQSKEPKPEEVFYKQLINKALEDFFQTHMHTLIKNQVQDSVERWLEKHMVDLVSSLVENHLSQLRR